MPPSIGAAGCRPVRPAPDVSSHQNDRHSIAGSFRSSTPGVAPRIRHLAYRIDHGAKQPERQRRRKARPGAMAAHILAMLIAGAALGPIAAAEEERLAVVEKTGKERMTDKASDEQRTNDCKVPQARRTRPVDALPMGSWKLGPARRQRAAGAPPALLVIRRLFSSSRERRDRGLPRIPAESGRRRCASSSSRESRDDR